MDCNSRVARYVCLFVINCAALTGIGCTSLYTFPYAARAGDTVTLSLGKKVLDRRSNMSVDFKKYPPGCTQRSCTQVVYTIPGGNPAVRALVNLYADPISNLVVGYATNQNFVGSESTWGGTLDNYTSYDRNWFASTLFLDLPPALTEGLYLIQIKNALTNGIISSVDMEILPGAGSPDLFYLSEDLDGQGLSQSEMRSLERSAHYTIYFSRPSDTVPIPHTIQLELTHDPDVLSDPAQGIGIPYVTQGSTGIKNISWARTGNTLRVILTPTAGATLSRIQQFSFYVAGGIRNLGVAGLQAFDADGYPIAGISAAVTAVGQ